MPEPRNQQNRENQQPGNGSEAPQQEPGFALLTLPSRRFELGQLVATPGALAALEQSGASMAELIGRHLSGDWGVRRAK